MSRPTSLVKCQERAEFYMDLIATAVQELQSIGIEEEQAHQVAYFLCDKIRHLYGGAWIYIPKDVSLDRQLMQSNLYQDYSGKNHVELKEKYGISLQYVYRLIKAEEQFRAKHKNVKTPREKHLKVQFSML